MITNKICRVCREPTADAPIFNNCLESYLAKEILYFSGVTVILTDIKFYIFTYNFNFDPKYLLFECKMKVYSYLCFRLVNWTSSLILFVTHAINCYMDVFCLDTCAGKVIKHSEKLTPLL